MNYVPDLSKVLYMAGIMGSSGGLLILFRRVDKELQLCCSNRLWKNCFWNGLMIAGGLSVATKTFMGWEMLALLLLGIYLLVCTVTDVLLCQVYDVMQYIGIFGGIIWVLQQKVVSGIGGSLIIFALMQYAVLMRMYGKADGMGYCICSLYLAGLGADIEGYLIHMFISFSLLAVVQGMKGNISKKGNLKKAVALYPYISMGFLIMWIFLF